jgi:sirohydrochlorin cobaltochelatase
MFSRVAEGFWQQPPFIRDVWNRLDAPEIFVMPVMISEGYFTTEIIPRELGLRRAGGAGFARVQVRDDRVVRYCEPVGTHHSMTDALSARAKEVLATNRDGGAVNLGRTALFIVGHGTGRNDRSREAIERQVGLLRARAEYAEVHAVFMEESPRVEEVYQLAAAPDVIVVPFFISDGLHVREDIPMLLGEKEAWVRERLRRGDPVWHNPTVRQGKRVWYTPSIGTEGRLADVILDRIREVAACSPTDLS